MDLKDFTEVARFGSALEAEAIGHALDQYGIPFIVKSEDVLFGQGSAGGALMGVSLWVPADQAEEVAQLLNCVVRPPLVQPGGAITET